MKNIYYVLLILLTTLLSCSSVKILMQTDNLDSSMTNDTIRIANDTLEYEVIIIDPGFSTWLASRSLPQLSLAILFRK
jgi:hypothetical protein